MSDTIFVDPGNETPMPRIWVFLSRDENGNEGIMGAQVNGQHFPMLTGTERVMRMMEKLAEDVARKTGKKIVLVEYTTRRDVREISA